MQTKSVPNVIEFTVYIDEADLCYLKYSSTEQKE